MSVNEEELHRLCDDEYAMSRLVVEQIAVSPADYEEMWNSCMRFLPLPGSSKLEFFSARGPVEITKADWVKTPTVTVCAPPKR